MPRKTILFGNGLGMALMPAVYNLDTVLKEVWNRNDLLTIAQKDLISQCLPQKSFENRPSSEEDLDRLQQVLVACEVLNSIELNGSRHWLSSHGLEFPHAIHRFIHKVATAFYNAAEKTSLIRCSLPASFTDPLCSFIRDSKSHIATLNYDSLLSDAFMKDGLMGDRKACLLDGTNRNLFKREYLFRTKSIEHGWFFHLHGSPLYYETANGQIRKLKPNLVENHDPKDKTHLVLTHVKHKPSVIAASDILRTYWEFFARGIEESKEIIVFGYSGADSHLNKIICQTPQNITVKVIEWIGVGSKDNRQEFWDELLKKHVNLVQMEAPFEFNDW